MKRVSKKDRQSHPMLMAGMLFLIGCSQKEDAIVIYTSQDRVYASEIFSDFTKETGTTILPLFDSESVKTTALANRLIAESRAPRCDVFWSNEELMLRRLAQKGVIDASSLVQFGYRTRRLIVNTNHVSETQMPRRLDDLLSPQWKGKVALAYPLYGTTLSHLLALRSVWGRERWKAWCQNLLKNQALIVDGNSAVVRLVGRGQAWIGLTDSDDIAVGLKKGLPIRSIESSDEFLAIANSVAVVIGCPHPQKASALIEYLQSHDNVKRLVSRGALEGIAPPKEKWLSMNWDEAMSDFDADYEWLGDVFFR